MAADGNPITNKGGYPHNGAESLIRHSDFGILSALTLNKDGTESAVRYVTILNTKGQWRTDPEGGPGPGTVEWDGAKWIGTADGTNIFQNASSSLFPPSTGWTVLVGSGTFSLSYNSFFVEEAGFLDKSYADLRAHANGADTFWVKCIDIDGVPHYVDLSDYITDREFNAGETQKNENYYGDNCGTGQGAVRHNGNLVTDNGVVVFHS